jgi:hypothetical protein
MPASALCCHDDKLYSDNAGLALVAYCAVRQQVLGNCGPRTSKEPVCVLYNVELSRKILKRTEVLYLGYMYSRLRSRFQVGLQYDRHYWSIRILQREVRYAVVQ